MARDKIHRCWYCKELLNIEIDNIVTFEMGKKTISKKEAHYNCRQKVLDRQEFYDWLITILDVPSVDKDCVIALNLLHSNGYSWEVLKHAIRAKLKDIINNFSKSSRYWCAIIRNQCPISYKEFEKEKNIKIHQERIKKQFEESKNSTKKQVINITAKEEIINELIKLDDISTL